MNFLGHSMISWEIDEKIDKKKETLYGNFAGDFLNELLHEKFHNFKGIVSDMFIDHFLSKNFYRVFNENINDIEKKILYNLHYNSKFFTEEFERTFNWIQLESVLIKYADINFLEMAFRGISHRIRNGEILREAVTELKKNYDVFEEKSLSEFNYTKNKSIEKFLEINKIGGVEKWEKFY